MVTYHGIEIYIVKKAFEHFVISDMWSDEVREYFTFSMDRGEFDLAISFIEEDMEIEPKKFLDKIKLTKEN